MTVPVVVNFIKQINLCGRGGIKKNFVNPFPDMSILGFSSSAANKDMMAKYGRTGIQFSAFENIVGKGEISRYE